MEGCVQWNIFYKRVILWNVQVFWARLACFGQFVSDPQISSKLQNGINDPKELENKIYTLIKGRETFYGDHTVPVTSYREVQYIL